MFSPSETMQGAPTAAEQTRPKDSTPDLQHASCPVKSSPPSLLLQPSPAPEYERRGHVLWDAQNPHTGEERFLRAMECDDTEKGQRQKKRCTCARSTAVGAANLSLVENARDSSHARAC